MKGENSIKIFGRELDKLEDVAKKTKSELSEVPGVADPAAFNLLGQPNLTIRVDRAKAARYGIAVNDVNAVVQAAIGGQEATRVYITCPAWNPATELQAIGRAHRTGQVRKVTVRRLIYVGDAQYPSVEQSIMQLQEGKAKVCAEVLNDPRLETQVPNVPKTKINIQTLKKIFAV